MKLSFIFPIYKPHEAWEKSFLNNLQHLKNELNDVPSYEFILVNDGSPKGAILQQDMNMLCAAVPELIYIDYPENRGKGYAVRLGVQKAVGDLIVYTDFDFPFGRQSVLNVIQELRQGADIVAGYRDISYINALNCPKRSTITRGLRFVNRFLGLKDYDAQAGLKGFNYRGKSVFLRTAINSFLFDTEFLIMALRFPLKIRNVHVSIDDGIVMSKKPFSVLIREMFHLGCLTIRSIGGFKLTLKGVQDEIR